MDIYTIEEHTHRFACWAAARAASISMFTNKEIAQIIHHVALKEELNELLSAKSITHDDYYNWFIKITDKVESTMSQTKRMKNERLLKRNISFGIAAKVVSIYVKTCEIIPKAGKSLLSQVAFPPVDSILLKKMGFNDIAWSTFNKETYLNVIRVIWQKTQGQPFWKIETNWSVE